MRMNETKIHAFCLSGTKPVLQGQGNLNHSINFDWKIKKREVTRFVYPRLHGCKRINFAIVKIRFTHLIILFVPGIGLAN